MNSLKKTRFKNTRFKNTNFKVALVGIGARRTPDPSLPPCDHCLVGPDLLHTTN